MLPHLETPGQIIAGTVPPVNAEYLHECLPRSELHLIDTGHFVREDAADEYAALVSAWWVDGYKKCGEPRKTTTHRQLPDGSSTRKMIVREGRVSLVPF
jgi:hypothetical protein